MGYQNDDGGRDPVDIGFGECVRDSGKAIRVELEGPPDAFGGKAIRELWIPQSCVHADSEVWKEGQSGRVVVMKWFAEKQGLQAAERGRR